MKHRSDPTLPERPPHGLQLRRVLFRTIVSLVLACIAGGMLKFTEPSFTVPAWIVLFLVLEVRARRRDRTAWERYSDQVNALMASCSDYGKDPTFEQRMRAELGICALRQ